MKVTLGEKGMKYTWQKEFPKETKCCRCKGMCRIAFVAHEDFDKSKTVKEQEFVCRLHENRYDEGEAWLHDCACFAIYLCKKCLKPTALYNQG